jgi:hypothetical protein
MTVSELISELQSLIAEDDNGSEVACMEVKWGGGDPENPPYPHICNGTVFL